MSFQYRRYFIEEIIEVMLIIYNTTRKQYITVCEYLQVNFKLFQNITAGYVARKGIYSIENFLTARRLMYWQVYLHKTSVVCEKMLTGTLTRAKELARKGEELYVSPALRYFLYNDIARDAFFADDKCLENFLQLDDTDIWCALKAWTSHPDKVLSALSTGLVNRHLFKVEVSAKPFSRERKAELTELICSELGISKREARYLLCSVTIEKDMYSPFDDHIEILYNDGSTCDIAEASDMFNLSLLQKKVKKYYLCYQRMETSRGLQTNSQ